MKKIEVNRGRINRVREGFVKTFGENNRGYFFGNRSKLSFISAFLFNERSGLSVNSPDFSLCEPIF